MTLRVHQIYSLYLSLLPAITIFTEEEKEKLKEDTSVVRENCLPLLKILALVSMPFFDLSLSFYRVSQIRLQYRAE